jgi:hypothetical protein
MSKGTPSFFSCYICSSPVEKGWRFCGVCGARTYSRKQLTEEYEKAAAHDRAIEILRNSTGRRVR